MTIGRPGASPEFETDGAQHFPARLTEFELADIEGAIVPQAFAGAGVRLTCQPALDPILGAGGAAGSIAASLLKSECLPVRIILFDKSATANWTLGWHQDRTIAVAERADVAGYDHWTTKQGITHVEPPFELLAEMVTLRIHLDTVDAENAPLLIAPGSHRHGRIPEAEVDQIVSRCGSIACVAARGDIWAYATPILHASEATRIPTRRRVLQVDYSRDQLPDPLRWFYASSPTGDVAMQP